MKIGCPETVAAILPPMVEQFSRRYPGVVLHIYDVATPTLNVPQIRDRSLDLALLRVAGSPLRHRHGDNLNVEILFNDELKIVVGKESQWARRRKINLAALASERWILPPESTLNRRVVIDAFRACGLGPSVG